jgi:hypothetical protein
MESRIIFLFFSYTYIILRNILSKVLMRCRFVYYGNTCFLYDEACYVNHQLQNLNPFSSSRDETYRLKDAQTELSHNIVILSPFLQISNNDVLLVV